MDTQTERFLDIAQRVSANAQEDTLSPDIAVQFCKWVLPALLVELEVAKRVSERLDSAFPVPPQADCGATICSSRWHKQEKAPQKAAKRAAKKSRRKRKEAKHGGVA